MREYDEDPEDNDFNEPQPNEWDENGFADENDYIRWKYG